MKAIKPLSLLMILALTPLASFAKEGGGGSDGTRGGGEILWTDGQGRLRDLVDPSVCEYKMGTELRKEYPQIDQVLRKTAELDWYFAAGLKSEINQLDICFTKKLIRLRNQDRDSVVKENPQPRDQAAIRFLFSRDVYINRDYFNGMPESDRAYLIIHEAMHSFIPYYTSRRNESIRAAVKTLERVEQGVIRSASKLHADLDRSSVQYPWTAAKLQAYRTAIEFSLASMDDQRELLLNTANLDSLFRIDLAKVNNYLYAYHRTSIMVPASQRAESILANAGNDFELLDKIVNSPVTEFDPLMVAFSVDAATENAEFQSHVLNSRAMRIGPSFFAKMANKTLLAGEYRIQASGGYELLGIPTTELSKIFPALTIRPYTASELHLIPSEVHGFMRFLAIQAKRGGEGWAVIRAVTSQSEAFYTAFSVKGLQAQLEYLSSPIAREKEYLKAALPELVNGFRITLNRIVSENAGKELADQLDREIDWTQLSSTESNER